MKKRIITLLAVLALLVTCAVFAVQAGENAAPAAPGITLTGDETCPVCSKKLSEITDWVVATSATTDWTAEHIIIKADLTLTANPGWGADDQAILIRSSEDFSVDATAVTVSMNANARFNVDSDGNGAFAKKLTIYGDKATLQSKMQNSNGGMFRTKASGILKVYGDITIKPMEGASKGTSGGIVFVNKGEAHFTGVTFDGCQGTTGGVIYQTNGGSKSSFTDCVFKNCSATSAGVAFLQGGASAGFTNCDFYQCTATTGAGGVINQTTFLWGTGNTSKQSLALGVTNCTFTECSAKSMGGAIYTASGSTTLTNSTVTDCSSENGGAFASGVTTYNNNSSYLYGQFILDNTTVSGCTATKNGGCLYIQHHGSLTTKNNTKVEDCVAGEKGGFVGTASSKKPTITLEDSTIDGCKALTVTEEGGKTSYTGNGGAIYLYNGTVTMTAAKPTTFINCESGGKGGTIYMADGTFNMNSGSMSLSSAHTNGGTVLLAGGKFEMRNDAVITVNPDCAYANSRGVRIEGGGMRMQGNAKIVSTGEGAGNGVYVITLSRSAAQSYLQLVGNASVVGPTAAKKYHGNISVVKYDGAGAWPNDGDDATADYTYGKLKIQEDWDGEASVAYQTLLGSGYKTTTVDQNPGAIGYEAADANGETNNFSVVMKMVNTAAEGETAKWEEQLSTKGTSFTGVLYAESPDTENPRINGWTHELMPYRSQVVKADGSKYWVVDNDKAWDDLAANEGSYLKLWTNRYLKGITGNVTVDLNGHVPTGDANNAAVSFDAENPGTLTVVDSNAKAGEKGVTIPTTQVTAGLVEVAGGQYFVKVGAENATVYPVELAISSVSLRPTAQKASLYYTATVNAHAEVGLTAWGVAVTLNGNAGDDLDAEYLYTKETEVNGTQYNGVLIDGIAVAGGENNKTRANTDIYAKVYFTIGEETTLSEAKVNNLADVIEAVEALDESKLSEAQLGAIATMQGSDWYAEVTAE